LVVKAEGNFSVLNKADNVHFLNQSLHQLEYHQVAYLLPVSQ